MLITDLKYLDKKNLFSDYHMTTKAHTAAKALPSLGVSLSHDTSVLLSCSLPGWWFTL